jgi:PAS domain S-box-containing protein
MPGPSHDQTEDLQPNKPRFNAGYILEQIAVYLYAVMLPWIAAYLSLHTPALHGIPLALNFCAIAAAAAFFGEPPALIAVGISAIAFQVYLPPSMHSGVGDSLIRLAVIILAGSLVTIIIRQRLNAVRKLRSTLVKLQEQKDTLAQAQQASNSAAWTYDTRTGHTQWYEGGAEIFGRPHAEITAMGTPMHLLVDEERSKIDTALQQSLRSGAPFNVEFRVQWPNGQIRWLEARGVPLASNPRLLRGATIDVTQRKHAELALLRTEKLAIAGRLATSIAHEINNPLEAVTNLCYLAKVSTTQADAVTYLEMAERELARMAHFTSQTLRFHQQQSSAVDTDLNGLIRSVLSVHDGKLRHRNIVVRFEAAEVRLFTCYLGEIRQAIASLISNATDAMPEGGILHVRLREGIDWRTDLPAARITVADTGHGVAAEIAHRVYEPFFTTHEDTGAGLGLWVTAGILEKHNATIRMHSSTKPGRSGTTFVIILPYETGDRNGTLDHQTVAV